MNPVVYHWAFLAPNALTLSYCDRALVEQCAEKDVFEIEQPTTPASMAERPLRWRWFGSISGWRGRYCVANNGMIREFWLKSTIAC